MFARKLGRSFLFVAMLLTVTTAGWARRCSVATLKGMYTTLEIGTGTDPNNPLHLPVPFPVVLTAIADFDGAGGFSGTYSENAAGISTGGTFSGTYNVTSACAYSDEFSVTVNGFPDIKISFAHTGYISSEGILQEIRYIYTGSGFVVSGVLKKQ